MDTPYKNSTNLQTTANQNNQQTSTTLYPSMQPGFIPFEESTPKNRNKFQQNNRSNTPYNNNITNFSGSRQNQRSSGTNWSHTRNKNFRQNSSKNYLHFKMGDGDNYDNVGNFGRPQYQNANSGGFNKNRFNFPQNNRRENFYNNNSRRGGNQSKYDTGSLKNKDNINISEFVHPSMLEDPWKELIERHNIIHSDDLKMSDDKSGKEPLSDTESDKNLNSNDDESIMNRILSE